MIRKLAEKRRRLISVMMLMMFWLQTLIGMAVPGMAHARENNIQPIAPSKGQVATTPVMNQQGNNDLLPVTAIPVTAEPAPAIELTAANPEQQAKSGQSAALAVLNDIGPTQPEMQTFKSVNTNNMVDLFTGDFSYNIPLLDVGGYPVSLHYNSGISMDQEASWTGLGWNVSPGTVIRNMRGLPDDFDGTDLITKTESIKENKTINVNGSPETEIIGAPIPIGVTMGIFHNNYNGWGVEQGFTPSITTDINAGGKASGHLTGGLSFSSNSQYGVSRSPSLSLQLSSAYKRLSGKLGASIGTTYNDRTGISQLQLTAETGMNVYIAKNQSVGTGLSRSSSLTFAVPSYVPAMSTPYINNSFSFTYKMGKELFGARMAPFTITGSVTTQKIAETSQTLPAYGYMHYTKGQNDPKGLLDYNREKELAFNYESTPHIAIPTYTYDVFSITGEGTGGTFRAYRSDIGYIRDHRMQTINEHEGYNTDLGFGKSIHGGFDITNTDITTTNGAWKDQNELASSLSFTESNELYEGVYFKNPGEQTATDPAWLQAIGGESLMRAKLEGDKENIHLTSNLELFQNGTPTGETLNITSHTLKQQRDKRSQLINCLTAEQASIYGLNKTIVFYPENSVTNIGGKCLTGVTTIGRTEGYRKANHISEVDVTGSDGRRYVYGIPVYNLNQHDVTFSVEPKNIDNDRQLIQYKSTDNSIHNQSGKDNYYCNQETPAYAHSFLLTGILSPDYVDIKGDGITDDDLGEAIRFDYSRIYGKDVNEAYNWRIPYTEENNMANYNEGFKTYNRDDKASYVYGQKELWYLHSIESKNMIAVFTISARQDGYSTKNENGGFDRTKTLRKLDKIDLYSKSDLLKNQANAKPIKTVKFYYDYSLCKGIDKSDPKMGKLTLQKVTFSYNGGREKNPYRFRYNNTNPDYNPANYDRWGNYKDPADNPKSGNSHAPSNLDYPYALQDSTKAARNAAAWHLSHVILPSGGEIAVTYESDDYAYVQDKKAAKLYSIAGFGNSSTSMPGNRLFDGKNDNDIVFIDVPVAVSNETAIRERYLPGNDKLYFKLQVKMPATDKWGTGYRYEWIPLHADIEEVGVVPGNNNRLWIKVKKVQGVSPFSKVAIQFLRLNLPSKAYPNNEPGDDVNAFEAVAIIAQTFHSYLTMFKSFEATARDKNWCREVELTRSYARLSDPYLKKYGGGLRVKRVEVNDKWNSMTGGAAKDATYGQEYIYTTTEKINGQDMLISSGVAAWEPQIGSDENPFKVAIETIEKTNLLAPTNLTYSEEPLGESFYPSAMIGYSKVRVRTIHADAPSANGWDETTFYTTKDYPTLTEYTPLGEGGKKRYSPSSKSIVSFNGKNYVTMTQGFKVTLSDMNGKVKTQSSVAENDPDNYIARTEYYYKVDSDNAAHPTLNNNVPVITGANGEVNDNGIVGKEIEVMADFRQQSTKTVSTSYGVNLDLFFIGPFPVPLPSSIPFPQFEENRFRSSAIVKVITRHPILDSVVQIDKGSIVTTRNIVWDAETGEPILNRTNNAWDDPVYNFSYPAHWSYSGMEPAYKNAGGIFKNVSFINGKITNPALEKYFESGDELNVYAQPKIADVRPGECSGEDNCAIPEYATKVQNTRVWAISADKLQPDGELNLSGIYFIDEDGKFFGSTAGTATIIRSGKRNITAASVGSITSLNNPLRQDGQTKKIVIDDAARVVNASATGYKDRWKIEDAVFKLEKNITTKEIVSKTVELTPVKNFSIFNIKRNGKRYKSSSAQQINGYYIYKDAPYFEAARIDYGGSTHGEGDLKSWMGFDLSGIPANAIVMSARLSLLPHNDSHAEDSCAIVLATSAPGDVRQDQNHLSSGPHRFDDGKGSKNDCVLGYERSTAIKGMDLSYVHSWTESSEYLYNSSSPVAKTMIPRTYSQNSVAVDVTDLMQHMFAARTMDIEYISFEGVDVSDETIYRQCYWARDIEKPQGEKCQEGAEPLSGGGMRLMAIPTDICRTAPRLQINYVVCGVGGSLEQKCDTDTFYCVKTSGIGQCKSVITTDMVNPYRWGYLGNWRTDRSYVYYGDRRETVPAADGKTDIRTAGVLAGFVPYWTFTKDRLKASTDEYKWVWNQESTLFNKKGLELENHDPLDRYNSALYGYNQTLPVAVAQNARYSEQVFDGFEDYDYVKDNCLVECPQPRHLDAGDITAQITKETAHTGKSSLKLLPGQSITYESAVTTNKVQQQSYVYALTEAYTAQKFSVFPTGKGLKATYFGEYPSDYDYYGLDGYKNSTGKQAAVARNWVTLDYHNDNKLGNKENRVANQGASYYKIVWEGALVPTTSQEYIFRVKTDNAYKLWINGKIVVNVFPGWPGDYWTGANADRYAYSMPVKLFRGKVYEIRVEHLNMDGPGFTQVYWAGYNGTNIKALDYKEIAIDRLFSSVDTARQAGNYTTVQCRDWKGLKQSGLLYNRFAPAQSTSMLVSTWVKETGAGQVSTYSNSEVEISFYNDGGQLLKTSTLKPSGKIIEGWQRVEGTIQVHEQATMMKVTLRSLTRGGQGAASYFDDLRIHPYHSNMKSFVYDPISLRLMAELDENNYAAFYEYDPEGTLMRVKKETEQGIKTLNETHSSQRKEE